MRGLAALTLFVASCHLIGGAGDLEFFDDLTGGAGGGGGQGGGGDACAMACTDVCMSCDVPGMEGSCEPAVPGTECAGGACDAAQRCATGAPVWTRMFGDASPSSANDVAVDAAGDVVVVGRFDSALGDFELDLENLSTMPNAGDLFVAKLGTETGEVEWAFSAGDDVEPQAARAVALDSAGAVYLAGTMIGTLQYPGLTEISSTSITDVPIVAKVTSSGSMDWQWVAEAAVEPSELTAIAASTSVVVVAGRVGVGSSGGEVTLASGIVLETGGLQPNAIVALFDADAPPATPDAGKVLWGRVVQTAAMSAATAVALDATGAAWALGYYTGTVMASDITLPAPTSGQRLGFLIKFQATDGDALLEVAIGNPANAGAIQPTALVAVPDGMLVAGRFTETLDLGPDWMFEAGGGDPDLFVARYTLAGEVVWAKAFPASGSATEVNDVAIDEHGNIALIGVFDGSVELGVPLSGDGRELFVAKLGPAGEVVWAQSVGGGGDDVAGGVAFDLEGLVAFGGGVTARIFESMDLHQGQTDIAVVKLSP